MYPFEPQRDQTYLLKCMPNKLKSACKSVQPDQSILSACMKKLCILGYQKCSQWRFGSDCAKAQADLNLYWEHMSEGMLSDISAHLFSVWLWIGNKHEDDRFPYIPITGVFFANKNSTAEEETKWYVPHRAVNSCLILWWSSVITVTITKCWLRWPDTFGKFSTIVYKGDNFCHFLFAFLHTKSPLKRGLL